jgi:hypothetical protein
LRLKKPTFYFSLLTVLLLSALSLSCKQGAQTSEAKPSPSPTPVNLKPIAQPPLPVIGKPYPGKGVVKLINLKEGWIEIDHEEIKDLMPKMIMEWHVQKPSQLRKVKVGDNVEFTVVETGKGQFITELWKAK